MRKGDLTALSYGILIWLVGFVWGTIVLMTPALRDFASIPYVSRYPAISFPLLIAFAVLAWIMAVKFLARFGGDASSSVRLGMILALTNFVLDVIVIAIAFRNGIAFFQTLTIWIAYALLFAVPIIRARRGPAR